MRRSLLPLLVLEVNKLARVDSEAQDVRLVDDHQEPDLVIKVHLCVLLLLVN